MEGADHLYKFIWWEPKEIKKTTIINFALFKNGFQISPVYHKTYFVNNDFIHDYQFPVISLITDSLNLFDFYNGIYVPGKKHEEDGFNYFAVGNYHNRGSDWERKANITYFNDIGEIAFQTDVGYEYEAIVVLVFLKNHLMCILKINMILTLSNILFSVIQVIIYISD